ncbi:uncharacterized protein BDZ99DRAFT_459197 [Mytilinidion resinicola]|uniref:Uncharacterized protein n=1 Tax=Mytilinidion resinicola TaxID=574789 RepID=A0A6A6Z4R9_9PEZI|nr:uncharacterized protein BDZ99DRAFT_459197 [Mytilinidion resinicola]KAF2815284.1 hypothetical protein BDZ99DRAFT_459197 [Mytilinidion resinicola]
MSKCSFKLSDFEKIVRFDLEGSDEPAVIHLSVLARTALPQHLLETQCEAVDARGIEVSTFKTFSSWLYYDDKHGAIQHGCRSGGGTEHLMKCYEAATRLIAIEVNSNLQENRLAHHPIQIFRILHYQCARFKDDVIDAIAAKWMEQNTTPSGDEAALAYSVTKATDDPLRRLVADFYIWGGGRSTAVNIDFQRDLNNSLITNNTKMRANLDKIRLIVESVNEDERLTKFYQSEAGEEEDWLFSYTSKKKQMVLSGWGDEQNDRNITKSALKASLNLKNSKLKEIAQIKSPTAPYEENMAQYHEASQYHEAFVKALETAYCK